MLALEKVADFLRRDQLPAQADGGDQLLNAQVMAHKPLQIVQLEAARPEHLLNEHFRRGDARPLELAHHRLGGLGDDLGADMDAELLLLLDQQQPLVGLPLDLPALLLGLFIRPVAGQ